MVLASVGGGVDSPPGDRGWEVSAFRKTFSIACFVYAGAVLLSLFKLIPVDSGQLSIGFIIIFLIDYVVGLLVEAREKSAK